VARKVAIMMLHYVRGIERIERMVEGFISGYQQWAL